jgi:hypothetical protein
LNYGEALHTLCGDRHLHESPTASELTLQSLYVMLANSRVDVSASDGSPLTKLLDHRCCCHNGQFHFLAVKAFLENGRILDNPEALVESIWRMLQYHPLFLPIVLSYLTLSQWRKLSDFICAEKRVPYGHFPHLVALLCHHCPEYVTELALQKARDRCSPAVFEKLLLQPWNSCDVPEDYEFISRDLIQARRTCADTTNQLKLLVVDERAAADAAAATKKRKLDDAADAPVV